MYRNLIENCMKQALACLVILLTSGFPSAARPLQATASHTLVFTRVNVIAATGAPLQTGMTIVIRDGQIESLGKTGRIKIPRDSEIVDARGKFLIPGLWDMHAHLGTDDFDKHGHLALFVANGVTGIRIMDGDPVFHQWRDEISAGLLLGPRMMIASPIIGQNPISASAAREVVRQAKLADADLVKVHDGLSRDAYFAVVDEARKLKLPVEGHVPVALTAAEVSRVGQKSIEHFTGLDEAKADVQKALELAAILRRNHTWLCPTLIMRQSYASLDDATFAQDPRLKYVKPSWARRWVRMTVDAVNTPREEWTSRRALVQKEKALVGLLQRQGVKILAGTDEISPFCAPGFSLHDELALLVEAGLTPLQALQSATLNPARFFNLTRDLGTIEKGKLADLVLLDANPLRDIHNTQKINAVVVNGRLLDRQTLNQMLSKIEAAARTKQ
jgi:imidazolonepropionase-like amidohydrolase